MDSDSELPIFFDRKGRRWKILASLVLLVSIISGLFLYITVPELLRPVAVQAFDQPNTPVAHIVDPTSGLSPTQIAESADDSNVPVIGDGPLVRIAHIQSTKTGTYAIPLYAQTDTRLLTDKEKTRVSNHQFAIERYGATYGKRIVLTFDDGPDPKYTPQILDMLSKYSVEATFFVTGANVIKYPEIAERMVREGHTIANHTFTHADFNFVDNYQAEQETTQTQRAIRAVTGRNPSFFRLPYGGNDDQSLRDSVLGILTAQRLGYVVTAYDFDSQDWKFADGAKPALPLLEDVNQIVLLHDAGGDRSYTVTYLEQLVAYAKSRGYTFLDLEQHYEQLPSLNPTVQATLADKTSYTLASMYLVWPRLLVSKLFIVTVATLLLVSLVYVILAMIHIRRTHYRRRSKNFKPLTSVVIPAYNEEKVLAKTVQSVLKSYYRKFEILIVDDGSSDTTARIARRLSRRHKCVRAFHKANGGKATALNHGIRRARGEILVVIDADTVLLPSTIGKLVRHFVDPDVGAVAGTVKVGNIENLITRWQALDYIVGTFVERNAQALLRSLMIVPGACGAWRRKALLAAGSYSHVTLAEDFDLTLGVHRLGYKVLQDNAAIGLTEAPATVRALAKQRFRWIFGNVQTYWKHRDLLLRRSHGWLSMLVLPIAVFNTLLPIVFVPLLLIVDFENIVAGNFDALLFYFGATLLIQFIMATAAIILARERAVHLLAVPATRFVYSPIRTFLLYRTTFIALRGVRVGWNKLQRRGTVKFGRTKAKRPLPVPAPASVSEQDISES